MANLRKQRQEKSQQRRAVLPLEAKVALFGRVSSDKQAKEQTIERQQSLTRELLHVHFKDKVHVSSGEFWDEGYNLEAKDRTRNFWHMMSKVEAGEVNTIIVASEDRVFRGESAKLRGEITDILRHNEVRLITSNSNTLYSRSQTTDRLVTSIKQELGSINKLEAVKTLQHGRRRKLKEQAKWYLNICPYGLRCDRTIEQHEKTYTYRIVEEEAKYVRDIFKLYLGQSPKHLKYLGVIKPIGGERIAQVLNENQVSRDSWIREASKGIGTRGWDKQKVLRIMQNETYAGRLKVIFPASDKVAGFQDVRTEQVILVPAIVDERSFKQAQKIHQARRHKLLDDYTIRTDRNFLHGLLRCPICKSPMRGRVANGKHRYYGCPNTSSKNSHPLLRAEDYENELETYLIQLLSEANFKKLTSEVVRQASSQNRLVELRAKKISLDNDLGELKKKTLKLLAGWEDGLIDDDIYRERSAQIKEQRRDLEFSVRDIEDELSQSKSPHEVIMHLEKVKNLVDRALSSDSESRYKILRLVASELLESVELVPYQAVSLTAKTSLSTVKAYLNSGRVIAKDVREAFNWQPKRFLAEMGKWPRKARIEYKSEPKIKTFR